ncbi:sensor histidine kinase [Oceanispirochaeta sp. M1]|uniref:sensor histidine kinase n=2 Tax=Oceanispirochaeta TaxID=2035349 RepID=UPI0014952B41|nr:ATP-binding protein [Oceanispirochaeta sp. M1]
MLDILEKDRNIISYELHDDLAQKLAQISQFFNHPDFEEESFALLKKYSEESIQQVRLVSNRLKTPALSKLNVQDSYEQLFSDYKILTGINLDYKIIGMKNLQMAESRVIHIFRIVQELLNNAIKHSQSEQVQISIIYSHPEIIVKYKDNGIGYDYKKSMNTGLGLSSIQFRMNMLEARWTQMDTQSNGVTLIFKVPVKNEEYITN